MNKIKQLREEKKMKQSELCIILNTTQATLSNWERGVHDPDIESLKKMVEVFHTTTDYILGITDNPHPQKIESTSEDLLSYKISKLPLKKRKVIEDMANIFEEEESSATSSVTPLTSVIESVQK